jgi:hypothetical protein
MAGVDLIVEALAAGASAGNSGAAPSAVRDAYRILQDLVAQRLRSRVESPLTDRAALHRWLGPELTARGVGDDHQVNLAARRLLGLIGPAPELAFRP